jgi:hypothetical protein
MLKSFLTAAACPGVRAPRAWIKDQAEGRKPVDSFSFRVLDLRVGIDSWIGPR